MNDNVETVEVYLSDQYSILLEDYLEEVNVIKYKFVDSLIERYNPTKKHNYYGIKTKNLLYLKALSNNNSRYILWVYLFFVF